MEIREKPVNHSSNLRWRIYILAGLSVFCVNAVLSCLSLAIVAMINGNSDDETVILPSEKAFAIGKLQVSWSETQKARMLQAISWGSLASAVLGGRCGEVFGPRRVIAVALLLNGVLNIFYPIIALNNYWAAYAARVFQGVSYGICMSTSYVVLARWAPHHERTISNSIIACGLLLGNALTHPIVGFLVSSSFFGGWPSVFILFGAINMIIVVPWYIYVYDEPQSHPLLSPQELDEILQNRSYKSGVSKKVPWFKLLTSLPVYAYLVNTFTYGWLLGVVSTQVPSFYEDVLNVSHRKNGLMTALPWIFSIATSLTSGYLADRIRRTNKFSLSLIRKGFVFVGIGFSSIWMLLVTRVGENSTAIVSLFILSKAMGSLNIGGGLSNHLDISPSFAGTLAGMHAMILSLSQVCMNEAVAQIIGDEPSKHNWYNFFHLTAAITLIGVIFFCIFASGQVQKWDPSWQPKSRASRKKRDEESEPPLLPPPSPSLYLIRLK